MGMGWCMGKTTACRIRCCNACLLPAFFLTVSLPQTTLSAVPPRVLLCESICSRTMTQGCAQWSGTASWRSICMDLILLGSFWTTLQKSSYVFQPQFDWSPTADLIVACKIHALSPSSNPPQRMSSCHPQSKTSNGTLTCTSTTTPAPGFMDCTSRRSCGCLLQPSSEGKAGGAHKQYSMSVQHRLLYDMKDVFWHSGCGPDCDCHCES